MIENSGGPAFPFDQMRQGSGDIYDQFPGMTLRDYFAAKALPGLILEKDEHMREWLDDLGDGKTSDKAVAQVAYLIADAMLAERAK